MCDKEPREVTGATLLFSDNYFPVEMLWLGSGWELRLIIPPHLFQEMKCRLCEMNANTPQQINVCIYIKPRSRNCLWFIVRTQCRHYFLSTLQNYKAKTEFPGKSLHAWIWRFLLCGSYRALIGQMGDERKKMNPVQTAWQWHYFYFQACQKAMLTTCCYYMY